MNRFANRVEPPAGPEYAGLEPIRWSAEPALPPIRHSLERLGMALIQAEAGDEQGQTLRRIVGELGQSEAHDLHGRRVWDVRYNPATAAGGTRSLTLKAFPYHTDGSFEEPAPGYIALYVVREDCFGAGETLIVEAEAALRLVTLEARQVLRSTGFRFLVPAEFDKGIPHRDLPILLGNGRLRYRREIIDESRCSASQLAAIDELDAVIDAVTPMRFNLPSGMILLLDNARFLHARTAILDPARHLLRMRFSIGSPA